MALRPEMTMKVGAKMLSSRTLAVLLLAGATCMLALACSIGAAPSGPVTLNVVTAGDTNMEELQRNVFGPRFSEKNEHVTLNVVGTGPGDPGSRAIHTRLKTEQDAGTNSWDIDVAIIHQSVMEDMIKDRLLLKYVPDTSVAQFVTADDARNALGTNVEGYVIPLFHSQVAIAYNPKQVADPPKSFEELVTWIKAHPNRFGYNGVTGGMSGEAFVTAYLYWRTGRYEQYAKGPYDKALEAGWPTIFKDLKSLPVTLTQGNSGTLDMLNRDQIDMGPVWVDMYLQWQSEGRLGPDIKLALIEPGLPGQPMYVVIPAKAANADVAKMYVEFVTSPEIQAEVIVGQLGWYPGIDPKVVLSLAPEAAKKKLFGDIPPDVLNKNGLMFPLGGYLKDLETTYEATK